MFRGQYSLERAHAHRIIWQDRYQEHASVRRCLRPGLSQRIIELAHVRDHLRILPVAREREILCRSVTVAALALVVDRFVDDDLRLWAIQRTVAEQMRHAI